MIYDELEYAENLIKNGFVKKMSRTDLSVLGKLYLHNGLPADDVRFLLIKFCKKHHKGFNEVIFGKTLDEAMASAIKYPLRLPMTMNIYKSEIDKIRQIKNYRYEKILFTMLYCAKYEKAIQRLDKKKEVNNRYYVNKLFPSILTMVKMHMAIDQQESAKEYFHSLGLVNAVYGNEEGGFEIFFVDEDKNVDIFASIQSPSHVWEYYMPYCESCGKEIEKTGKKQKYCGFCSKEKYNEINRNRQR